VSLTIAGVLRRLRAEGMATSVSDDDARAALRATERDAVPWYGRVAAGVGAWLAMAFLIAFTAAMDLFRGTASAIAGGAAVVVAAALLRRAARAEFLRQLAVATSFAGQALFVFGIHEATDSAGAAGAAAALLSALLVRLVPDALHRFLSTVAGSAAAAVAAHDVDPRGVEVIALAVVALAAWVWRGDASARSSHLTRMLAPVGYGLLVGLFALLLLAELASFDRATGTPAVPIGAATTAGITTALVALALAVLAEHGTPPRDRTAWATLAAAVLLGAATLSSPGVAAGVAVLVLGFDRRSAVLIGVATLFLLVFGAAYYHGLALTLLGKSAVLAASGAVCLAARAIVARSPGGGEAA
jgi:hypothetical protein